MKNNNNNNNDSGKILLSKATSSRKRMKSSIVSVTSDILRLIFLKIYSLLGNDKGDLYLDPD